MSSSNLVSNNGISIGSELDLKRITLTGTLTANNISAPLIYTPYLQTEKIDLFGTSTITLGQTTTDGFIQSFTNKNLNLNADNNLLIGSGADTFMSADTIYLRSGGVDKLVIGNASSTFTNEVDFNNTLIVNNVGAGNQIRVPGTSFDYFNVAAGQCLVSPNGIIPRFACFEAFSGFANDIFFYNTAISAVNYSFTQTQSNFNKPLVFNNLTTAQRNALTPANGMVIYNTTTSKLQCYGGGIWNDLF